MLNPQYSSRSVMLQAHSACTAEPEAPLSFWQSETSFLSQISSLVVNGFSHWSWRVTSAPVALSKLLIISVYTGTSSGTAAWVWVPPLATLSPHWHSFGIWRGIRWFSLVLGREQISAVGFEPVCSVNDRWWKIIILKPWNTQIMLLFENINFHINTKAGI